MNSYGFNSTAWETSCICREFFLHIPAPVLVYFYEKYASHILPKPLKNVWSVCLGHHLQILKVSSLGYQCNAWWVKAKVTQSCPTLCDPMDYTVHGILQARILEWEPFPSPGDLPNPGIEPRSPALQADSLPAKPLGKPREMHDETSLKTSASTTPSQSSSCHFNLKNLSLTWFLLSIFTVSILVQDLIKSKHTNLLLKASY